MSRKRVLVADNRDSFVHTLAGYLADLGADVDVMAADDSAIVDSARRRASAVVVSPGPGHPTEAGWSLDLVALAHDRGIPLLGVCLGHQALAVAFGARVEHAPELLHGITSAIHHDGDGIFAGQRAGFPATRYHSLAVVEDTLPDELQVTARTESGVVMGLRHCSSPLVGVQFHPESVLTEGGHRLLGHWLELAGVAGAAARGADLHPRRAPTASRLQEPVQ